MCLGLTELSETCVLKHCHIVDYSLKLDISPLTDQSDEDANILLKKPKIEVKQEDEVFNKAKELQVNTLKDKCNGSEEKMPRSQKKKIKQMKLQKKKFYSALKRGKRTKSPSKTGNRMKDLKSCTITIQSRSRDKIKRAMRHSKKARSKGESEQTSTNLTTEVSSQLLSLPPPLTDQELQELQTQDFMNNGPSPISPTKKQRKSTEWIYLKRPFPVSTSEVDNLTSRNLAETMPTIVDLTENEPEILSLSTLQSQVQDEYSGQLQTENYFKEKSHEKSSSSYANLNLPTGGSKRKEGQQYTDSQKSAKKNQLASTLHSPRRLLSRKTRMMRKQKWKNLAIFSENSRILEINSETPMLSTDKNLQDIQYEAFRSANTAFLCLKKIKANISSSNASPNMIQEQLIPESDKNEKENIEAEAVRKTQLKLDYYENQLVSLGFSLQTDDEENTEHEENEVTRDTLSEYEEINKKLEHMHLGNPTKMPTTTTLNEAVEQQSEIKQQQYEGNLTKKQRPKKTTINQKKTNSTLKKRKRIPMKYCNNDNTLRKMNT